MNDLNLEIKDFGNINYADIEINKITVVGGVNDSGKSTACKLLYCFLKSNFLSQKEAVMNLLVVEINSIPIIENSNQDFTIDDDLDYMISEYERNKKKIDYNSYGRLKIQNVDSVIKLLSLIDTHKLRLLCLDSQNKISSFINEELIYNEGVIQYQGSSRLYSSNFESNVKIYRIYKYQESVYSNFNMNSCKCKTEGDINNSPNVYYIDVFSILNIFNYEILDSEYIDEFNGLGLVNHIDCLINDLYDMGSFGSLRYDPIYSEVMNRIQDLIPGRVQPIFFTNGFSYEKDGLYIPTFNTSSGIKQIGLIELLITKEKLKPGSFLIIDEPEVNLHPKWQFKFAEILVLLAKEADIKIYINSHSPTFIESIDAFAGFYDMENDVNYYLTEEYRDKYNFTKIDSNELYKLYNNLGNVYNEINKLKLRKRLRNRG